MRQRLEQIKKAHLSARPKTTNPAWVNCHNDIGFLLDYIYKQPKQEWVGLTDKDLQELGFLTRPQWWLLLEAKLKEKNGIGEQK